MKVDLRQLRHVVALDRHRNFARAAEEIGLTQPALSRSIQAMEAQVGARLFDRSRGGVEPTAVGARLIELARPLLAQAQSIELELEQLVGLGGGLLRVGAGPYPSEISVGAALGRLASGHAGIQVDVVVGDWPILVRRLLADELDLVVAEASHSTEDPRLLIEPLPVHRGVFYCRSGHPLAGKPDLSMEDMARYPIAMTTMPGRLLDFVNKVAPSARRDVPEGAALTAFRVDTPQLARSIVLESDVLSAALPRQLGDDLAHGRVVILPIDAPWLRTGYGIIRLARRTPSPAAAEFMRVLRGVENEIAAEEGAVS